MPLKIKIILFFLVFFLIPKLSFGNESLKSIGKFKNWETFTMLENQNKICFAQSKPVLQAPKKIERESRLFITFRPAENIKDEISVTAGYAFNNKNKITAKSGKYKYSLFSQENFAWVPDTKSEKKLIRIMKQGSRLMITGYNQQGSQTIDHYSLMGFTKAYNSAKKNCG